MTYTSLILFLLLLIGFFFIGIVMDIRIQSKKVPPVVEPTPFITIQLNPCENGCEFDSKERMIG